MWGLFPSGPRRHSMGDLWRRNGSLWPRKGGSHPAHVFRPPSRYGTPITAPPEPKSCRVISSSCRCSWPRIGRHPGPTRRAFARDWAAREWRKTGRSSCDRQRGDRGAGRLVGGRCCCTTGLAMTGVAVLEPCGNRFEVCRAPAIPTTSADDGREPRRPWSGTASSRWGRGRCRASTATTANVSGTGSVEGLSVQKGYFGVAPSPLVDDEPCTSCRALRGGRGRV